MDHDDESPIGDALKFYGGWIVIIALGVCGFVFGNQISLTTLGAGAPTQFIPVFLIGITAVFCCLGCYVTKFYKECCRDCFDFDGPDVKATSSAGRPFDLYVTVEKLAGNSDVLKYYFNNDFYIRVKCNPNNPVKQTCVRKDGHFFEVFKFRVTAECQSLVIQLWDQDVLAPDSLGEAAVDLADLQFELNRTGGQMRSAVHLYSEKVRAGSLEVTYRCPQLEGNRTGSVHAYAQQSGGTDQYGTFGKPQYFDAARLGTQPSSQVYGSGQHPRTAGSMNGYASPYASGGHHV